MVIDVSPVDRTESPWSHCAWYQRTGDGERAYRATQVRTKWVQLCRQQEAVGQIVEQHYYEMLDLQTAISDAMVPMHSEFAERTLRQRAEALGAIIREIECTFTTTGETGSGWSKRNSELTKVKFYPVVGESLELPADSKGTE